MALAEMGEKSKTFQLEQKKKTGPWQKKIPPGIFGIFSTCAKTMA